MSACKTCGHPSYVDPANDEDYGHCVECIIGTFGQTKDMNLLFAAPELLMALQAVCVFAGGFDWMQDATKGELDQFACFKWAKDAIATAKGTQ